MKGILLSTAVVVCALNASAQDAATIGPASLSDYIYTAPQGWTVAPYPDGILINSPVSNTGEKCFIGLWPMRPSSGDLETDAGNIFPEVFRDFEPRQGKDLGGKVVSAADKQDRRPGIRSGLYPAERLGLPGGAVVKSRLR